MSPIFSQSPIEDKKSIPSHIVEEYKEYIKQLKRKHIGILEFSEDEDIHYGKRILKKAGEELLQLLKIRRPRGKNELQFEIITKDEFKRIQRRAKAKGSKGKVLLVDVDSKIPNIALGKLSHYWKNRGYYVEYERMRFNGYPERKKKREIKAKGFDKVYVSNIFTVNQDAFEVVGCDDVEIGGVGSNNNTKVLPQEIHELEVDYTLFEESYPNNTTSYGFITRGCPRKCPFCFVPETEGNIRFDTPIEKILNLNHDRVSFLDNNILGYSDHKEILQELVDRQILCDFNQGLDIRFIDDENAKLLSELRYMGGYVFALDHLNYIPITERKLKIVKKHIPRDYALKFFIYHDAETMSIGDTRKRIEWCRENRCLPYLMRNQNCWTSPYREFFNDLAAYCNQPGLFKNMTFKTFIFRRRTKSRKKAEWMNELYYDENNKS